MAGLFGDQPQQGGLLGTQQRGQSGIMALSEPQKAGVFDYVLATLAGGVGGAASLGLQQRQQQRAYKGQQEGLAQLGQSADAAGLTPAERFALRLNPQSALDMLGKRTEPQKVAGGDSLFMNGQFQTAPRLVEDAGIYGTQTPGGYQQTGQRGQSIAENQTALKDQRDYNAKLTPEGFLPTLDPSGGINGANLIQGYGKFALQKAAAGSTKISVPVTLPAQNAFADQLAKNYANRLDTAQTNSDTARDSLSILANAKQALNGGAITGAGAGLRLNAARALALTGDKNAKKAVENTQTFESVMGGQVLAIAKQLGSGSGISNADRDFAGKVAGGSISLDEGTINRLIDIQQTQAKNTIRRGQSMGAEAYAGVPSAQGLPASTFGGGARGGGAAPVTPSPSSDRVRVYNPATGNLE